MVSATDRGPCARSRARRVKIQGSFRNIVPTLRYAVHCTALITRAITPATLVSWKIWSLGNARGPSVIGAGGGVRRAGDVAAFPDMYISAYPHRAGRHIAVHVDSAHVSGTLCAE